MTWRLIVIAVIVATVVVGAASPFVLYGMAIGGVVGLLLQLLQ